MKGDEETQKIVIGEEAEDDAYYIENTPFITTPEGEKLLDKLLAEHNELNHIHHILQKA